MHADVFYLQYNNPVEWQLTEAGAVVDHSAITRLVLHLEGAQSVDIDSDDTAGFFTMQADRLVITPMGAAIAAGNYMADLVVYSADHPDGTVWFTGRSVKVR